MQLSTQQSQCTWLERKVISFVFLFILTTMLVVLALKRNIQVFRLGNKKQNCAFHVLVVTFYFVFGVQCFEIHIMFNPA